MAQQRLRIEQKDLGGKACQRSVQKGIKYLGRTPEAGCRNSCDLYLTRSTNETTSIVSWVGIGVET
jgi:hypothetical protein